jgi:hypothetical protein
MAKVMSGDGRGGAAWRHVLAAKTGQGENIEDMLKWRLMLSNGVAMKYRQHSRSVKRNENLTL